RQRGERHALRLEPLAPRAAIHPEFLKIAHEGHRLLVGTTRTIAAAGVALAAASLGPRAPAPRRSSTGVPSSGKPSSGGGRTKVRPASFGKRRIGRFGANVK